MCFIAQTAQNNLDSNTLTFLQIISCSISIVYLLYNNLNLGDFKCPRPCTCCNAPAWKVFKTQVEEFIFLKCIKTIFGQTLNPADLLSTRGSDHGSSALSPRRADSCEVAAVSERRPELLRPPPGSGSQEAAGQLERRRHAGPSGQVSAQRGDCLFRNDRFIYDGSSLEIFSTF